MATILPYRARLRTPRRSGVSMLQSQMKRSADQGDRSRQSVAEGENQKQIWRRLSGKKSALCCCKQNSYSVQGRFFFSTGTRIKL
jgi:hypothetical protein